MPQVYINGEFLPIEQASIPVLDRGFIFGDGVYEVIPAYAGRLFRFEEHMQRMENSLRAVRIDNPLTLPQWQEMLEHLISINGGGNQSIYFQITRGVAPRDHVLTARISPTVFAMSHHLPDKNAAPVAAITSEDIRWKFCNIKAISLLPNVLLKQQAVEQGAYEAILIRDGLVTEGAASNVFIVSDGLVRTPIKNQFLLPGITRDLVLELLEAHAVPYAANDITEQELLSADEIWLTSSTREIVPVTRINAQAVGNGQPGPVWEHVCKLYKDFKDAQRTDH